jgi:hypothetical protein
MYLEAKLSLLNCWLLDVLRPWFSACDPGQLMDALRVNARRLAVGETLVCVGLSLLRGFSYGG